MAKNIDGERKTPTWFWLTLMLILMAAIIIYFVTQYDGRTDQRNIEKSTWVGSNVQSLS